MGGVVGVLGGMGIFASRIVFGLEKLTNRAYEYVLEKQQRKQTEALQELHNKLASDQDPRTHKLLEELWTLYRTLERDIKDGTITVSAHEVLDGVDRLFHMCTQYLARSYDLLEQAKRLRGDAQQSLLQQREELIREVDNSVHFMENKIEQLQTTVTMKNRTELAEMRAELDETIRVAKRAEERTAGMGEKPYDIREFE